MKVSKNFFLVAFIWLLYLLVLVVILEIFTRYIFHYHLDSFSLKRNSYFEMDKLKIWNKRFIEERKEYFKNWPIELETFEATSSSPMYIYKPDLKMASIDGKKLVSARPNDQVFWSSGTWGFRGKDFLSEKASNVIRIVTLGASTTEGSQGDNETYPFYLQSKLTEEGYDIEVINAGHHAYNINDLLTLFKERVLPLKPDIVIFYEVSNNTNPGEWLAGRWDGWNSWDVSYGLLFKTLHQHSAAFVFLVKSLGFEDRKPPTIQHVLAINSPKPSIEAFEQKVDKIIELARENQIRLVLTTFVTVANKDIKINKANKPDLWHDIYFKWYPFMSEEIALIYDGFNQSLRKLAAKETVPIIDLASQFPKDPQYFVDHIHLTPEGNQLLANFIADFLIKNVLPQKANN